LLWFISFSYFWHFAALYLRDGSAERRETLTYDCVCVFVCVCMLCLCLIDNIGSKIVPLEKGVVIYGANAVSLLTVVLFVLPINVHV